MVNCIFSEGHALLKKMLNARWVSRRCVVLSVFLGLLLLSNPLRAADAPPDLPPPPPESGDTAGLIPIDDSAASAGAELPPPPVPGAPEAPMSSASAEPMPPAPLDSSVVETPAGEALPPLPIEGDSKDPSTAVNVPPDSGLSDVPSTLTAEAPRSAGGPSEFSSSNELKNVAMNDRIKAKDLTLWLSLGPSYGTLTGKGSYSVGTPASAGSVGGLGYNAGIGFMLDNFFQMQFDFTGTPKTKNSTVDQAMFGFGPRFGFLTVMGVFGVQQGPDPTTTDNSIQKIFAIGARAGLDLVLKHATDSRMSIGLSPEVYYITPQGADGYQSVGVAVSLRIYGYDTAF